MTVRATATITLGIKGPFLCSATAPAGWGLDATFDRDYLGRPYIDRSHIKGKLREALTELGVAETGTWLGKEGDQNNANLYLSDFRLLDKNLEKDFKEISPDIIHRIKIDEESGVVADNALMMLEELVKTNETSEWVGELLFHAASKENVAEIIKEIKTGLKWITAFGAEKGIGFGKLQTVKVESNSIVEINSNHQHTVKGSRFSLVITSDEPLMLGDVKIKNNFQESRDYIYGSAIKAALAQAMNTACGIERPAATAIDSSNSAVSATWPLLARYFSQIRFTHAFPSLEQKRPRIIPFSVVKVDTHYDVALQPEATVISGKAPTFQTDWKDSDYPAGFGWAFPRTFAKTRTAIDTDTRQAKKGSMFTYQYVCPQDSYNKNIQWIADASLDGVRLEGSDSMEQLQSELVSALSHLEFLGKRASRVKIQVKERLPSFLKDTEPKSLKRVILTLQSDALMIETERYKSDQTAENLRNSYQAYFKDIFGSDCTLFNFFAMQKMLGGYIRHRGKECNGYYPYFLTTAGSVFVLDGVDIPSLEKALKNGLPLPAWAGSGPETWRTCPFVPENGFGEIALIHEYMESALGIKKGRKPA